MGSAKMKTVAIIQARTSSTRLPGKVLLPLNGKPMLLFQLERLAGCRRIDKLVVATSNRVEDDSLSNIVMGAGYSVYRGDLYDVLDRYLGCAVNEDANNIVRITGDCPLIDPALVDEIVGEFLAEGWDYLGNSIDEDRLTVPDGFDIEVFKVDVLHRAAKKAILPSEREHVTPWLRSNEAGIRWKHYRHKEVYPSYRLTVDDPRDYDVVNSIVEALSKEEEFYGIGAIISYLASHPEIATKNMMTPRNEGYKHSLLQDIDPELSRMASMGSGSSLWKRAKRVIPGGNMLLSKRPEMFLPEHWPAYFSRASGCTVWDIDGVMYKDMSIMGVGTNTLGYGHPEVDQAVRKVVQNGNMSTLNCPEEVYLAERLVNIHPWSQMVRFARSGGEANAIAIRIARAATGRDTVAICGYHGWHDWYLATNLGKESGLEEHLLPGLNPAGVPNVLSGTVKPFSFNQFDQLKEIIATHRVAAVKMEVQRNIPPAPGFLQSVRKICSENGIVLIFDECTSGFRESFGGLHLKYGVYPDIAVFGKTLGNGYAITAVVGRRDVMEACQSTFISSTFWSERIGPTAALKTLEVMERDKSWERITQLGRYMQNSWQKLASKHGLEIVQSGLDALAGFSIKSPNSSAYKTLISQEMLKKGYLASTNFYPSTAHSVNDIDRFIEDLDGTFEDIAMCEQGRSVSELLETEVCHTGFKRLN